MTRVLLSVFAVLMLNAAASADVTVHCTNAGCVRTETPNFTYVPPPPPIFSFTRSVDHRPNGNKVITTTTYRDGQLWSKERAVIPANHAGKHGEGHRGR